MRERVYTCPFDCVLYRSKILPIFRIFFVCRDCQVRISGDRDVRLRVAANDTLFLLLLLRVRRKERVNVYVRASKSMRERIEGKERKREGERE